MDDQYKINIGKYLDGALQGKNLLEFEAVLERDKALREEVESQKQLFEMLQAKYEFEHEKEELVPFLKGLEQNVDLHKITDNTAELVGTDFEQTPKRPAILRKLAPLASIAAAAALLIFLFLPQLQNQSYNELAENNFELYELINEQGVENTATLYEEAKKNYNAGSFEKANKQFTDFLKKNPKAPKVWLAKGCAAFKLGDINAALNSFEKVIDIDESGIYHPYAHWYLALCYLKKEEPKKAIYHLKQIKEGADNYTEAKRLLQKLQ